MFKLKKRKFAAGTFIPTPARLLAIIQLCLTLSLLFWHLSAPFFNSHFTARSNLLLYENVMGKNTLITSIDKNLANEMKGTLARNASRFEKLPLKDQEIITKSYQIKEHESKASIPYRFQTMLRIFFIDLPPFEIAWIVFSIILSIMVLKKAEGASSAIWLIPIITLLYCISNLLYGTESKNPDDALFPTEAYLVQNYLPEALKKNLYDQQNQLMGAWNLYLIHEWTDNQPSVEILHLQVEDGNFAFNAARLIKRSELPNEPLRSSLNRRLSPGVLLGFMLWNFFFAWLIYLYTTKQIPALKKVDGKACKITN